MGLDMYLYVEKYVSRKDYQRDDKGDVVSYDTQAFTDIVTALGAQSIIDPDSWTGITVRVPVGYWRKANAIHSYIVRNHANGVDECQDIGLSRNDLMHLRNFCQLAVDGYEQNGSTVFAEDHLPPQSGFFFGSTEMDEWYFNDLKSTIHIIERCLEDEDNDWFIYRASW